MAATHFSGPVVSTGGFTGDITGDVTGDLTGIAKQGASSTAIVADGALPLTNLLSLVHADGTAAVTLTLADGAAGQMKIIKYGDGTGTVDVIVYPANFYEGFQFTLDAARDVAILVFDGDEWHTIYSDGTIDAAS
mgnify:CR=1 FL=1